ncbi:hypothetical protein [Streptomyces sp. NPDC087317]
MPEPLALIILAGVAAAVLGCICFLASGITYFAHTIRRLRRGSSR